LPLTQHLLHVCYDVTLLSKTGKENPTRVANGSFACATVQF
jgi:hypothetical protein